MNERLFTAGRINGRITRITGACGEMMYLAEGSRSAALLDTGTGIGRLKDFVEGLTDKPVKVLLTHGHLDHAAAAAQFDDVYMSPKDDALYRRHNSAEFRKSYLAENFPDLIPYMEPAGELIYTPVENGDEWDLGGFAVRAYECAGHTKGSVVFLMPEDGLLLLGDACNSNTLVYDQDSTTVEEYRDNLIRLEEATRGLYGHTIFSHDDKIRGTDIVRQMIELCSDVLDGHSQEELAEFMGQKTIRAKKTLPDGTPADGSAVNIMYVKERLR